MTWHDWDCDCPYADFIHIGMACGEFQVIRTFDVEMEKHFDCIDLDKPDNWPDWKEKAEMLEEFEEDDDEGTHRLAYICFDDNQVEGEFMQRWIHTRTGEIVFLGKVFKRDEHYCDIEAAWEICDDERHSEFYHYFNNSVGKSTRHLDYSVHPDLAQYGYTEFWLFCSDDLNYERDNEEAAFYQIYGNMANHIQKMMQNLGYRRYVEFFGFEGLAYGHLQEYMVALKVAQRHHYDFKDKNEWRELIDKVIKAGKDIHNPHFVAPNDIEAMKAAMDREIELNERRRVRERVKEEQRRMIENQSTFLQLRGEFLDISFGNEKFDVHVLRSIAEYIEEGESMHHCVGKMNYWSKPSSICIGIRDKENKRVATAEISLNDFHIIQLRGVCNAIPKGDLEIRQLIENNAYLFKEAQEKQFAAA